MIVGQRTDETEVFTVDSNKEVLPVFSFKEEAEMFLQLGVRETGWQVRESTCGELTSILYSPCKDVRRVALDPLPEMVAERTVGFVSLTREAFIEGLLPSAPIPSATDTTGIAS